MMMRKDTMLISKQTINAPFFIVKSTIVFFQRRILSVFVRVGYAFLCCEKNNAKNFLV